MIASPRHLLPCAALAAVLTLLNAVKPLHIDDAAYYCYAAQIAEHPLSPYGFEIFWGQQPCPANRVLAPPVLPYWWAAGLRLLGESPFLWKVWLFPISLLLVFALHALARRFAAGIEMPLVCLVVLSPSLLPSLNLMLDVPALALGLTALALFLRALDRESAGTALFAGFVAGLALQTKYTALVTPAVLLLGAALYRRPRLGMMAAGAALTVFAGWETFVALRHGESHFLCSLAQQDHGLLDKIGPLFRALLNHAGGLAPATALLALVALGASGRMVLAAATAGMLGLLSVVLLAHGETAGTTATMLLCRVAGIILIGTVAAVGWRLLKHHESGGRFLCGWLALELAGYFVLTPFPAARRVLPVLVVAALLVGRLAARTPRRGLVWSVTAAGVLLGLMFYAVDLREAVAQKRAIESVVQRARNGKHKAVAWYVGTWGLKFYAERAGLRAVVPDRSALQKGDWLVVPDAPLPHQQIVLEEMPLVLAERVDVSDPIPLRTVWCYYGGNLPLQPCQGPRVSLRLYRVTEDFTPASCARLVRARPE